MCPECAAPVADSLRPTAFGFLSDADAKRLHRGVKRLAVSLALFMLGVVLCLAIPVLGLLLVVVSVLPWLMGWATVAGVRAPGASQSARHSVVILRIAVWGQLASMVGMVVELRLRWMLLGSATFVMPFVVLTCAVLGVLSGYVCLTVLVKASGVARLLDDARVLNRLGAWFLGLCALAMALLVSAPAVGAFVSIFAAVLGLGVAIAWWAFLNSLADVLRTRVAASAPRRGIVGN